MTENPELEVMESSTCKDCELEEEGTQKISISNQINRLQYANAKSDSFIVDMERLSHLTRKDISPNSRINFQKSLTRKGSQRGGGKKINSSTDHEEDASAVPASSARGLVGVSTLGKPMVVTVGTTDHPINPQVNHQVTITTGTVGAAAAATTAESRFGCKRFSFRRSSPSWTINPRRILFFFATLSSVGTILLIYFTLSMAKLSGDDNALNW